MSRRIISADSHITEPPDTYTARIDKRFRDRAPRMEPELKVVCVEADAGWVPHYMYRMDHAYERHRHWLPAGTLSKLPSEYFRESIYVTFQDDWVAFQMLELANPRRIMWANDFPHSDSTWPWSQDVLKQHTSELTEQQKDWILHDDVAELYGLPS